MEKRFLGPLIISIVFLILAVFLSFLPVIISSEPDIIPMIPGGVYSDVIITMLIPYLFFMIMLFLGPVFAPFLVALHKMIKLGKYEYFITTTDKKRSGFRILTRSIFPGMFAINLAIYIALYGGFNSMIYYNGGEASQIPALIEYASIIIGMPIASLIIIPLWMIQTSGLMCAKRIESYNYPVSPDIENVSQFYIKLLKGFVGISFIISYSMILFDYFTTTTDTSTFFVVFLDPIIIILFSLPIALIIEMREGQIKDKMVKVLNKLKIDTIPKKIKIE